MTLLQMIYNNPEPIILESTNSLIRAHLPHYEKLRNDYIRERYSNLLLALTNCIESNSSGDMLSFVDNISNERFSMGFEPHEVQMALNIFEEVLWKNICKYVDEEKQFMAMELVTGILSKAKEELVSEYAMLSKS